MKSRLSSKIIPPVELTWSHFGVRYRLTNWPEARFERQTARGWEAEPPDEDVFASAAALLDESSWRRYLEYLPTAERSFLAQFKHGRLAAYLVIVHCPELLPTLTATSALTSFLAAHDRLRGIQAPRWEELTAIFERNGIYGVLEWLGLPASRQTLAILGRITDPDVPQCLLEPLRALLWDPVSIFELQSVESITDRKLAHCCHGLAA